MSKTDRPANIKNEADIPWTTPNDMKMPLFDRAAAANGGKDFEFKRKGLGRAVGASKLGTSLYEVPPGKTAWPRHFHLTNEEAIYVLSGEGTLTLGHPSPAVHRVRAGDYMAFPCGPQHCHVLVNDHPFATLRYLCMSTNISPELTMYPDSGKIGCFDDPNGIYKWFPLTAEVPYFTGEGNTSRSLALTPSNAPPSSTTAVAPTPPAKHVDKQ